MRLSILICTIEKRKTLFDILIQELKRQCKGKPVEVLYECDNGDMSIGAKRNKLLSRAKGEYICYIDDDDWIDGVYVDKILEAIEGYPDCVQMIGIMNTDGYNLKRFEHSIAHQMYYDHNGIYYRYPNHLNPIRRDIAIQFKFPEIDYGEDTDWATQIHHSGLLVNEHPIDRPLYHYRYSTKK